jgi:ketosteroid isomerase-like protein
MTELNSASRAAIVADMLAASDRGEVSAMYASLTDDIVFRACNMPEIKGKQRFDENNRRFQGVIKSLRHEIHHIWQAAEDPDVLFAQMTAHYELPDGRRVSLPCCNVFRLRGSLIAEYQLYMDMAPIIT